MKSCNELLAKRTGNTKRLTAFLVPPLCLQLIAPGSEFTFPSCCAVSVSCCNGRRKRESGSFAETAATCIVSVCAFCRNLLHYLVMNQLAGFQQNHLVPVEFCRVEKLKTWRFTVIARCKRSLDKSANLNVQALDVVGRICYLIYMLLWQIASKNKLRNGLWCLKGLWSQKGQCRPKAGFFGYKPWL